MVAVQKLISSVSHHKSMLCIGLDVDPKRIPASCGEGIKGMCQFILKIVEATSDVVAAYKPNLAFYEALGPEGLSLLKMVCDRIPDENVIILDGKRNDIGNTVDFYARALFDNYGPDWITVNPYMGYDSLRPFLDYKDKGIFVLCLTSNPGAKDFQQLEMGNRPLYMHVAHKVASWNKDNNCGLVAGATYPDQLISIRKAAEQMPLLIPGVGAQGGDLEKAVAGGTDNFQKPALINISRSVLYASSGEDFDQAARATVDRLNSQVRAVQKKQETPPGR